MPHKLSFRHYYRPIQPTVGLKNGTVSYQEFAPADPLKNLIYCYWQLRSSQTLNTPFTYQVVADGCIDVFFDLDNPADSQVMGFCKRFTAFPLSGDFNYLGIRFFPSVFTQLYQVKAAELCNRTESLQTIVPALANYIADINPVDSNVRKIIGHLDHYFLQQLTRCTFDWDWRFYGALKFIFSRRGVLHLENEIDTGLSSRQLRRLFQYYVGESGKAFSKVVQFQNVLASGNSTADILKNRTYFDLGYYDQAHFSKDFKRLYGTTPKKA